jgi:signal transduction histidine kinase
VPEPSSSRRQSRLETFWQCRVCRRVTAVTFLAILVVEAAILVPSYRNFERDQLMALDRAGEAAAAGLVIAIGLAGDAHSVLEEGLAATPLTGLRVTAPDGRLLAAGEPMAAGRAAAATQAQAQATPRRIGEGDRYQAAWTVQRPDGLWRVEGRLDAAPVAAALVAFLGRIAGLVLIIALVVTAATMAVLGHLVFGRVMAVGDAMRATAAAPDHAAALRLPVVGGDELGDMTAAFNDMAAAISSHAAAARAARRAAEAANAAKSDFLASMSHELRTPLNAVIGFSQMLEMEAFGPLGHDRYRTYVRDIRGSGDHLLTLINDILDLSKAQAGRMDLYPEDADLEELCDAALRMVATRGEQAGLRLTLDVPRLRLWVDGRRVRQILLNLLSNAIKFTPSGGTIHVAARRLDNGDLAVTVGDSGSGMTAEQLRTAFEPFAQADNQSADQAMSGTGLGLPLARQMAEAHGGRLEADSTPGVGTAMTLVLPSAAVR